MRLIDADAVIKSLWASLRGYRHAPEICAVKGCILEIEETPTVTTKQIPLEPIDQEVIGMYLLGRCPNCGHGANAEMDRCDVCGQALDWRAQ